MSDALHEGVPPRAGRRRSYLVRHWQGALGLGTSFWVNGTLLSLGLGAALVALSALDITVAPRLVSFVFASTVLLTIPVAVWQFTGIWRSAGRVRRERRGHGRRAPWAVLARATTACGVAVLAWTTVANRVPNARAYLQIAFGTDPTPHHVLHLLNDGKEIEIAGGIDFGTAADLATLLDASAAVRTIDLNSIGGRVAEAEKIRDMIRARRLATYTGAVCASACTVIYMAGEPRFLGPGGKLGFHRYSFPGLTTEQDAALNRKGQQALIEAGVDPGFAARAFATPSTSVWVPDQAALVGARVVTKLVNGMEFSSAAVEEGVTAEKVDRELSASPTFAALKRADPAAYAQAVQGVVGGVQQGRSLGEVSAQAQRLVFASVARLRPVAPDEVQVRIAAITAEEATALAPDHPGTCLALLNGSPELPADYAQFLPKAVQGREAAVTAAILDGGATRPAPDAVTDGAAHAIIGRLWARLRAKGVDTSAIGHPPATVAEQRSACTAMAAFFSAVAEMPPGQVGPLMRRMLHAVP